MRFLKERRQAVKKLIVFDEANLDEIIRELEEKEGRANQCLVSVYIGKLLRNSEVIVDDKVTLQPEN